MTIIWWDNVLAKLWSTAAIANSCGPERRKKNSCEAVLAAIFSCPNRAFVFIISVIIIVATTTHSKHLHFLCWFSVRLWHCCWRMELMWIPEIIVARLDFLYFLLDSNFMNIGFDLKIKIKIKIASCDYRLVRWFIFSANFLYWRILFCVWKYKVVFQYGYIPYFFPYFLVRNYILFGWEVK